MTSEELRKEVFQCMHCDQRGLPFVRDTMGKFYRFPPTIGAIGSAPLLFVGINPRVSDSNRNLHNNLVHNYSQFENLSRNKVGTTEYIGQNGIERHYALHNNIVQELFPNKSFASVACVTELHLCASNTSVGLPYNHSECASKYLSIVLEIVRLAVVFAVGKHVERTLHLSFCIRDGGFYLTWRSGRAPVVTLPHPNAFGPRHAATNRAVIEARRYL